MLTSYSTFIPTISDRRLRTDHPELEKKVLNRMAATLAHNVNNGLTGVIGHIELALRDVPQESSLRDRLQESLECAMRVADVVRRMVIFALRPEKHQGTTLLSLRGLAEHFIQSSSAPSSAGVVIGIRGDGEGWVQGNVWLLLLALEQLLSNAREASPEGGHIVIHIWEDRAHSYLSIIDKGPGLSAEARQHLFEPFFTTKTSGHLGLGLTLSRDIIEAHGGTVRVDSVPGRGVTATIAIPTCQDAESTQTTSTVEPAPLPRRTARLVSAGS